MLIRCSSIGKIMATPKSAGEVLSVGAKTYLTGLARESVYGFREELYTKPIRKGNLVEAESIRLYNDVFFEDLRKNTERRDNGIITGECDLIIPGNRGIDIKSSWSLATFPVLAEDCHDTLYEWQARGYMALWDIPKWEVAYCMVSTPDELIGYEQPDLHYVDHIDPPLRVTTIVYERCAIKEIKIMEKATAALEFLRDVTARIYAGHGIATPC